MPIRAVRPDLPVDVPYVLESELGVPYVEFRYRNPRSLHPYVGELEINLSGRGERRRVDHVWLGERR